jgi:hypothetical protein
MKAKRNLTSNNVGEMTSEGCGSVRYKPSPSAQPGLRLKPRSKSPAEAGSRKRHLDTAPTS